VFAYADIAKYFGVSLEQVAFLTTPPVLLMRPVGAVIFGLWADRRGRRCSSTSAPGSGRRGAGCSHSHCLLSATAAVYRLTGP